MKVKKRDRVMGALKRVYAERHGKSLRWAQLEAAGESAGWKAFLAEQGGGVGVVVGGRDGVRGDLEKAGEAKGAAWRLLEGLEGRLSDAMADPDGDVVLIASLSRAVRDARMNWERAGAHERRLLEAAGVLVPMHVFHEVRTRGVMPLAELIGRQRDFIGSRLEVGERGSFYDAWDEWAVEWNKRIDDLNGELVGLERGSGV